jgi:hypothetical protein
MVIFARNKYDTTAIHYPVFIDSPISEFESIVIRNSGNDWFGEDWESGTMFRDVLMTGLTRNMDLECQAASQAIVYINGNYWGIHNIREKISEHFVASHAGVDPGRIDMLEANQQVIHGNGDHYEQMISFLSTNDIRKAENYAYVKQQMEVQNFINYELSQIYFDNTDWPGNNIKYWRPDYPGGKWRWIMFDTDFGFGLWNVNNVYNNSIKFATEPNGPGHPNPPWSTFLLRKLLENSAFRELFINSFADQINTSFNSDLVKHRITTLKDAIDEEMFNHVERWGGSYQQWIYRTSELSRFANLRPNAMQNFIISYFAAGEKASLTLDVSDPAAGSIHLNTILIRDFPWKGTYFTGIPVTATAVSNTGYRFTGWSGGISAGSPRIRTNLSVNTLLTANFEAIPGIQQSPVGINEIYYIQDSVPNPEDWIELFNNSDQYVDISEWVLRDSYESHSYVIQAGTLMEPYGYLVVCRDMYAFKTVFPGVSSVQGGFDFGFSSSGEVIRLFDRNGQMVDVVNYGFTAPWPIIPPGSNHSIALLDPDWDNFLAGSWGLSNDPWGTPGGNNSFVLSAKEDSQESQEDILFQASPNPFQNETRIIFYSSVSQPVRIAVHDLNGRFIELLTDRNLDPGYHEFMWNAGVLKEGIYILTWETPGLSGAQKLVKIR